MDDRDAQRLAADAVADLIGKLEPGSMATRFVVLAEMVAVDGERAVWTIAQDGMKRWETLGLLDYARSVEHAASVRDRLNDNE